MCSLCQRHWRTSSESACLGFAQLQIDLFGVLSFFVHGVLSFFVHQIRSDQMAHVQHKRGRNDSADICSYAIFLCLLRTVAIMLSG